MSKRKINKKLFVIIDIVLLIITIFTYKYIYAKEKNKAISSELNQRVVDESHNPVFKIKQIIIYNSAYAVDNSDGELKNIDISQFSDIDIFIDNKVKAEEITGENTVSELYVDNIKVETNDKAKGNLIFNYKNANYTGKYSDLANFANDGIVFNVIQTNEKNKGADYNTPTFYTDCSNPLSFGFINKNFLSGCEVSNNTGMLAFDGSILGNTGVALDDLYTKISFTVHIINNFNEEYVCNVSLDNALKEDDANQIYSGYLMRIINPEEDTYNFLKSGHKK